MKMLTRIAVLSSIVGLVSVADANGQNPVIRDQYTADPTARVFNGKVYLYPSHDILAPEGKGLRPDWFCMEDYHVFSSSDLVNWEDHGVIVSQYSAPWVDSNTYSMWAPDCVERDGKYYFYFPANRKPVEGANPGRGGFGIGVAIADAPEGPYVPQENPIEGIFGIDPSVLIDKDGQAYIYYSMGQIFVAKLKDNMVELASQPVAIENLPDKGLKEGPFVFERNGLYYLTFPHVENVTERLEYAIGESPEGPFRMAGVIMDESPTGCWTNHHSIMEYEGQWYLFYHHNDYSPNFDKNRSTRIDSLFFNPDGTIQKVVPTLRGVGVSSAYAQIEIDRYSAISGSGAEIAYHDTTNYFTGWKTILNEPGAWIRYNKVGFGEIAPKSVKLNARSKGASVVELREGSPNGTLIAKVKVAASSDWNLAVAKAKKIIGTKDLVVVFKKGSEVEIDWVQFE